MNFKKSINKFQAIGIVSASTAIILAFLIPFLSVKQQQSTINWPDTAIAENTETPNVTSPLATQTPQQLDLKIPANLYKFLPKQEGILVSTIPKTIKNAQKMGLFISASKDRLTVNFKGKIAASIEKKNLTQNTNIIAWSSRNNVGANFENVEKDSFNTFKITNTNQPILSGIFTDLPVNIVKNSNDLTVKVKVDNRFNNTATIVKFLAILLALIALLIAIFSISKFFKQHNGNINNKNSISLKSFILIDLAVIFSLIFWFFLAGGSPDDGYIRSIVETSPENGYISNYYRYFGAAEEPFSWYYSFLSYWGRISNTSVWLRIPNLIIGIASWLLIKKILLNLLSKTETLKLSLWTAGSVFLVFWFPMASGLRPESIIILGTVVVWLLVEKYLESENPLYLIFSIVSAIFACLSAPQGIIVLAIFISSSRALLKTINKNIKSLKEKGFNKWVLLLTLLSPITLASILIYKQQTFASVLESIRIKYDVGPTLNWAEEFMQYYVAFMGGVDGSLVNRLPILLMFATGFILVIYLLWVKNLPNVSTNALWRAIGVLPVAMFLHLFTPIKWVISFGIFTAIITILSGIAVPILDKITKNSVRNVGVVTTVFTLMLAITMAAANSWYWVWSFDISWVNLKPEIKGIRFTNVFVFLAAIGAIIASWLYVRDEILTDTQKNKKTRLKTILSKISNIIPNSFKTLFRVSPIMFVAGILVICELLVFTKAAVKRPNSYSVLKDNIQTMAGNKCSMANSVLVEQDTNQSFLKPLEGNDVVKTFKGDSPEGFSPAGFTSILKPYEEYIEHNQIHTVGNLADPYYYRDTNPGTGGGYGPETINKSRVKLPFGLNPKVTPFLGTYNAQFPIEMHSGWYKMPERNPQNPLIVISALGNIATYGKFGQFYYGQVLQLEYGKKNSAGVMETFGYVIPIDPGPQVVWRDLRIPVDAIPADAEAVRILARDQVLGNKQWLGFTPPRNPKLAPLQDTISKDDPILADILVAAQFPCQTLMNMKNGIWQIPKWRITPNRQSTFSISKTWQEAESGGILAIAENLLHAEVVSSYLENDWFNAWGTLQKYTPAIKSSPAIIESTTENKTGWYRDGRIPKVEK